MFYYFRTYQFRTSEYTTLPAFTSPFFLSSLIPFNVLLLYQNLSIQNPNTTIQLPLQPSCQSQSAKPQTSLFSNIHQHPKTQILLPLPPPWITTIASISLCLSIVAQSNPSYSMSANYFEVIKTCFLRSLISIYCYKDQF